MRGKNKSLLEDIIILTILGVLVYFTYTYFFPASEETVEKTTEIVQENKIDNNSIEPEKKEEIILPKAENRALEERVIENRTIVENKNEEKTPEPLPKEENILPKAEDRVIEKQKTITVTENNTEIPVITEKKSDVKNEVKAEVKKTEKKTTAKRTVGKNSAKAVAKQENNITEKKDEAVKIESNAKVMQVESK